MKRFQGGDAGDGIVGVDDDCFVVDGKRQNDNRKKN